MKTKIILLALVFCWSGFRFVHAQWSELKKIVASDRSTSDFFGTCDVDGRYAVVGAYRKSSVEGAAYVYAMDPNSCEWSQSQKLTAALPVAADHFGYSVAISENFIAIGANHQDYDANGNYILDGGAVYIFELQNGTWTEIQKLTASDREASAAFGTSVAIDQGRLIVGAHGEDGGPGLSSLPSSGAAYIFDYDGVTWTETQKITASDRGYDDFFGFSVGISGDYAVIGAKNESEDENGLNTISRAGSAYIFENVSGTWSETKKLVSTDRGFNEGFGYDVDIYGNNVIVGTPYDSQDENGSNSMTYAGSAFLFSKSSGLWSLDNKIVASIGRSASDYFGGSVSIYENKCAIGAHGDAEDANGVNPVPYAGSVYIHNKNGSTWQHTQKIVSSDRQSSDAFGFYTAISERAIIAGSISQDFDENGANQMISAGAAYIFEQDFLPADQPTIGVYNPPSTTCKVTPVQTTLEIINSDIKSGTHWEWYEGSCGGTLIGTGTSIVVSPTAQTTYYARGVGYCNGPCASTTITPSIASWHQSTKNTAGGENGKDIATDSDGNVYVVGRFFETTTLDGGSNTDITINTGSGPNYGSYVMVYDPCGDLIWEAHSLDSPFNEGQSIVLDEQNDIVYIAGNFESDLQFTSSLNPPANPLALNTDDHYGPMGYVAGFEMGDGSEVSLDLILEHDGLTTADALAIDEDNSVLFVGGTTYDNTSTVGYTSYIHLYVPSNGTIASVVDRVTSTGFNNVNRINDMDFHESTQVLYAIGDFENEVEFTPGNYMQETNQATVQQDAFLLAYEIGGNTFNTHFNVRGNTQEYMSGEGIAVHPSDNKIFFTGTYERRTFSPFQLGTIPTLNGGAVKRAYIIGHDFDNQTAWRKFAAVSGDNAFGKAVSTTEDRVFFTGNFQNGNVTIQGHGTYPSPGVSINVAQHIYICSYYPDGTADWANVTDDPVGFGEHSAESIDSDDDGHVFTTGNYLDYLGYASASSGAAPLVSSGNGTNAFILRSDESNGNFKRSIKQENPALNENILAPNPTTGLGSYLITNFDESKVYNIRIINLLGQVITEDELQSSEYIFNLSQQRDGIYFLQLSDGTKTLTEKIVKSN